MVSRIVGTYLRCLLRYPDWSHSISSDAGFLLSTFAQAWSYDTTRSVLLISIFAMYHLLSKPGVLTPPLYQICSTHLYLYHVSAAKIWSNNNTTSVLLISIPAMYLLLKSGATTTPHLFYSSLSLPCICC
ncbi:hypothetical protein RRG08_029806 [Elysia crispata]|uniref:Uncharacterized protein n=1 Tax=Elysia crispata TaxID=231223 RepID=A0AAE0YMF4_9GAST|nr:hypothetical protein RRG08_029806 [Elysia crispata]